MTNGFSVPWQMYKLPFRISHHFASELVDFAKANDLKPSAFPYAEAKRIDAAAVDGYTATTLSKSEEEFRATLDRVAIVKHRATVGGPQPAEMERMLKAANKHLVQQNDWIKEKRVRIIASLADLDREFESS